MKTLPLSSKLFFLTSLTYFTLLHQSELRSDYYIYRCNTGPSNCSSCSTSESSDAIDSDVFGSSECSIIVNGIFFESGDDSPTLSLTSSLPSPANGGIAYYATWNMSNPGYDMYIRYTAENTALKSAEAGFEVLPNLSGNFIFKNDYSYSPSSTNTIYLSNTGNRFPSGTVIEIQDNTVLEIALGTSTTATQSTINGAGSINFNGGVLSVPLGGTIEIPLIVNSDSVDGKIIGGSSSDALLIISGQISGLSGGVQGYDGGAFYIQSGYVNIAPTGGANNGTGVFIIQNGTTQISGQHALGNNSFAWGGNTNSVLQFPPNAGNITISSELVFTVNSNCSGGCPVYSGTIDTNGSDVTWSGDFVNLYTNLAQLQITDSNTTPGSFFVDLTTTTALPSNIEFLLSSGTLITNFASSSPNHFENPISFQGGVLNAENVFYTGSISVTSGTTSTMYFPSIIAPQITGAISGPGTLNVTGEGGALTIASAADFSGILNLEPSAVLTVYADPGVYGGETIYLNTNVALTFENIESPITSSVDFNAAIIPQGGGEVAFTTINKVTLNNSIGTGGSGVFFLYFSNPGMISAAENIEIEGVVNIEGQVDLGLGSVIYFDATTTNFSTVSGSLLPAGVDVITGAGSVVILGTTNFVNGASNGITNSFSGGLTLTSGTLTIYASDSLGSGIITGNGGVLSGEDSAINISNDFYFVGGKTTSFDNFNGFTLTGNVETEGSGTAGIALSDGTLNLNLISLTINDGTNFQTNGSTDGIEMTTSTISGDGGLILGGGSGFSPILDTLVISGNTASSYTGDISDLSGSGGGAIIIKAPVTFFGNNTFTGGLTLSVNSATASDNTSALTINSYENVGSGVIYAQGGGLTTATYTGANPQTITIANDFVYTTNSTTIFDITSPATTLQIEGVNTVSTAEGTAYITKAGEGVLYISEDATYATGTYSITVERGSLTINAVPLTTATSHFIHDGVLKKNQENFFALAEVFYGKWSVMPVTLDSFTELDVIVQPVLSGTYPVFRGNGMVTSVQVYKDGVVAPGVPFKIGALELADSIEFFSGSYFGIAINQDAGSILIVDNNATIGSSVTVAVAPESGPYLHTTHVILTSGLLEGKFAGFVIPNSFFLHGFLDYSVPNEVLLTIDPIRVSDLAKGANAIAVADALDKVIIWNREHVNYQFDSAGGGSALHPFIVSDTSPLLENVLASLLPLITQEEMTDALNQLQPAMLKGFTIVQEDNIVKVRDALSNRMDYILDTKGCFTFVEDKTCCGKDVKFFV